MTVFVVYRVVLGLVILGMLATGHAPTFTAG
jgi:hypothetical protein